MLCFVHIERAGGTTVHAILRNNYPGFLTLTSFGPTNDAENELSDRGLARLLRFVPTPAGIGGHNVRSYLDYERVVRRPVRYFTFLREPVARYLSMFAYQNERMHEGWTIDRFLEQDQFANFMTKRLAGSEDLDAARLQLESVFSFVGLTERFDESIVLLGRALGLDGFDPRYERRNVGPAGPAPDRAGMLADDSVRRAVVDRNALDLELYHDAAGAIYPRQRERFREGLEEEVGRLRLANERFRFAPARRLLWGGYKVLWYRNVERAIRLFEKKAGPGG